MGSRSFDMNNTADFRIHKYNLNGVRDKRFELKVYLIYKYIHSLGKYRVIIKEEEV